MAPKKAKYVNDHWEVTPSRPRCGAPARPYVRTQDVAIFLDMENFQLEHQQDGTEVYRGDVCRFKEAVQTVAMVDAFSQVWHRGRPDRLRSPRRGLSLTWSHIIRRAVNVGLPTTTIAFSRLIMRMCFRESL